MNRKSLSRVMARKANVPEECAERCLDAFLDATAEALAAGDRIFLYGFGQFSVQLYPGKNAVNPADGKRMYIPEFRRVKFAPGKQLKDAVQNGKTQGPAEESNEDAEPA